MTDVELHQNVCSFRTPGGRTIMVSRDATGWWHARDVDDNGFQAAAVTQSDLRREVERLEAARTRKVR